MTGQVSDDLQALKDQADISDVVKRFATSVDTLDFDLFRSLYADEVDMDVSSFSGLAPERVSMDAWTDQIRGFLPGFDATQHVLSNFVIDVAGDNAKVVVYMKAEHFVANDQGDNSHAIGGHYEFGLSRTSGDWKIVAMTLNVTWSRGNRDVYRLAGERAAGGSARDFSGSG